MYFEARTPEIELQLQHKCLSSSSSPSRNPTPSTSLSSQARDPVEAQARTSAYLQLPCLFLIEKSKISMLDFPNKETVRTPDLGCRINKWSRLHFTLDHWSVRAPDLRCRMHQWSLWHLQLDHWSVRTPDLRRRMHQWSLWHLKLGTRMGQGTWAGIGTGIGTGTRPGIFRPRAGRAGGLKSVHCHGHGRELFPYPHLLASTSLDLLY